MLRMPDGSNTVILQGQKRFKWTEIVQEEPYMKARVVEYDAENLPPKDEEHEALMQSLKESPSKSFNSARTFLPKPVLPLKASRA